MNINYPTNFRYTLQWIVIILTYPGYIPKQQWCLFHGTAIAQACGPFTPLWLRCCSCEAMGRKLQCSDQSSRYPSAICTRTGDNGSNKGQAWLQHCYSKAGCCYESRRTGCREWKKYEQGTSRGAGHITFFWDNSKAGEAFSEEAGVYSVHGGLEGLQLRETHK